MEYVRLSEGLWCRPDIAGALGTGDGWSSGRHNMSIDTLLFDVDGVLINVRETFRVVACETVHFYFQNVLKWNGESRLILPSETELFKLAGGFNNDWDLTNGVILFYLWKSIRTGSQSLDVLREAPPNLQEFTGSLKARGGGIRSAEMFVEDNLRPGEWEKINSWRNDELVRRIFCEIYAGSENVERTYGIRPIGDGYSFPGLYSKEKPILTPRWSEWLKAQALAAEPDFKVGIVTGRTWTEAQAAMKLLGLNGSIPRERFITEDDGIRKPDPRAIGWLAARLGSQSGVFVGDTLDDWATVEAYRKESPGKESAGKMMFCAVKSGAHGDQTLEVFAQYGADFVADDVNRFLDWAVG